MRSGLSFDHIFPIRNDASAKLMRVKADCLFQAGVIDSADRLMVYSRGGVAIAASELTGIRVRALASHPAQSLAF